MVIPDDYESEYIYLEDKPMLKTWIKTIIHPTINSFRELAKDEQAILDTSIRWLVIASIISAVLNVILNFVISMFSMGNWSPIGYMLSQVREHAFLGGNVVILSIGMQTCAIPIGILFTAMILIFNNWLANQIGGKGSFESFTYICVSWISPLMILSPIFYHIPVVSSYIMGLYYFFHAYLMVTTLRAIKHLSLVKALFVTFFPLLCFLGIAIVVGLLYGIVTLIS